MLAPGFPQGDLGELVLGHANGPPDVAHARAEVLHLCNRHAFVAGNHHDARAFEDLAEFLDHFLFLGSIHSFTPSWGFPRLMLRALEASRSGPCYGTRAANPRTEILVSRPVSGRN
jgi:hypothetical protein